MLRMRGQRERPRRLDERQLSARKAAALWMRRWSCVALLLGEVVPCCTGTGLLRLKRPDRDCIGTFVGEPWCGTRGKLFWFFEIWEQGSRDGAPCAYGSPRKPHHFTKSEGPGPKELDEDDATGLVGHAFVERCRGCTGRLADYKERTYSAANSSDDFLGSVAAASNKAAPAADCSARGFVRKRYHAGDHEKNCPHRDGDMVETGQRCRACEGNWYSVCEKFDSTSTSFFNSADPDSLAAGGDEYLFHRLEQASSRSRSTTPSSGRDHNGKDRKKKREDLHATEVGTSRIGRRGMHLLPGFGRLFRKFQVLKIQSGAGDGDPDVPCKHADGELVLQPNVGEAEGDENNEGIPCQLGGGMIRFGEARVKDGITIAGAPPAAPPKKKKKGLRSDSSDCSSSASTSCKTCGEEEELGDEDLERLLHPEDGVVSSRSGRIVTLVRGNDQSSTGEPVAPGNGEGVEDGEQESEDDATWWTKQHQTSFIVIMAVATFLVVSCTIAAVYYIFCHGRKRNDDIDENSTRDPRLRPLDGRGGRSNPLSDGSSVAVPSTQELLLPSGGEPNLHGLSGTSDKSGVSSAASAASDIESANEPQPGTASGGAALVPVASAASTPASSGTPSSAASSSKKKSSSKKSRKKSDPGREDKKGQKKKSLSSDASSSPRSLLDDVKLKNKRNKDKILADFNDDSKKKGAAGPGKIESDVFNDDLFHYGTSPQSLNYKGFTSKDRETQQPTSAFPSGYFSAPEGSKKAKTNTKKSLK